MGVEVLAERKLLKGNTIGVDSTKLEANAALRSIVRRDSGEQYNDFLTRLAQESGEALRPQVGLLIVLRQVGAGRWP